MNTFVPPTSRWHLPERSQARLITGIAISLLIHGLILSLQFGIQGIGLPGLELPWAERRVQPELSVRLVNAKSASIKPDSLEKPATATAPAAPESPLPAAETPAPSRIWRPNLATETKPTPPAIPKKEKQAPKPQPQPALQPKAHKNVMAQPDPKPSGFAVAPPSTAEVPPEETAIAEGPGQPEIKEIPAPEAAAPKPEESQAAKEQALAQKLALEESAKKAVEAEAKKQEDAARLQAAIALEKAKLDAEKNAQRLAAIEEARKLEEAKKLEQAKAEARNLLQKQAAALAVQKQQEAQQKLAEEEAAKREQALEAQKQAELKKQEAAKAERLAAVETQRKAEEEARRQAAEAARQKQEELAAREKAQELADRRKAEAAAEQGARDKQAAAKAAENTGTNTAAASGTGSGKPGLTSGSRGDLVSKALGQARQLDLSIPSISMPSKSTPGLEDTRRRTFFGRIDKDVGMEMYIANWRQKIERNGSLNFKQSSVDKARGDPIVVVAVRSDGSVENVTIARSSGRPELDEAVRRIVRLNARYSPFAPNLARQYDVVEIRHIWSFDNGLKLLEEVR